MSSTQTTEPETDQEALEVPRRTAVRRRFLDRLDAVGMVRPRSMTADAFKASRERLVASLAYLDDDNLDALAETVELLAEGPHKNVWPAEVTIRNFARNLQAPPAADLEIVRSWLGSRAGPPALDGGYLVELFRHLSQFPFPPNDYAMSTVRAKSEDNRRERSRLRDRVEAGTATDADREWLEAYAKDERTALDIVAAGDRHRAQKGQAA